MMIISNEKLIINKENQLQIIDPPHPAFLGVPDHFNVARLFAQIYRSNVL